MVDWGEATERSLQELRQWIEKETEQQLWMDASFMVWEIWCRMDKILGNPVDSMRRSKAKVLGTTITEKNQTSLISQQNIINTLLGGRIDVYKRSKNQNCRQGHTNNVEPTLLMKGLLVTRLGSWVEMNRRNKDVAINNKRGREGVISCYLRENWGLWV